MTPDLRAKSLGPRGAKMSATVSRIASGLRRTATGTPDVPEAIVSIQLTTAEPNTATGLLAHIDFPPSTFGRPYSVRQICVQFPPGFTVNFDAIPRCEASNTQLYLRGLKPWAASIIGSATAEVDFGWRNSERLAGPYHQFVLGDGEMVCYEHNQLGRPGPNGFTVFPLVFRAPLDSSGFTVHIPEAPSFRKPDSLHALKSIDMSFAESGVFRTPGTHTESGTWPFTLTFDYYVGARHSVTVDVPAHPTQPSRRPTPGDRAL